MVRDGSSIEPKHVSLWEVEETITSDNREDWGRGVGREISQRVRGFGKKNTVWHLTVWQSDKSQQWIFQSHQDRCHCSRWKVIMNVGDDRCTNYPSVFTLTCTMVRLIISWTQSRDIWEESAFSMESLDYVELKAYLWGLGFCLFLFL